MSYLKQLIFILILVISPLVNSAQLLNSATDSSKVEIERFCKDHPTEAVAIEQEPRATPEFNSIESNIISEAINILSSDEMTAIKLAHTNKQSITVNINDRLIQYEPGLPASGMTMFGENGFLIGREAFAVTGELERTVLHELYRLTTSTSADGVSAELAAKETKAAADFAERAAKELGI